MASKIIPRTMEVIGHHIQEICVAAENEEYTVKPCVDSIFKTNNCIYYCVAFDVPLT